MQLIMAAANIPLTAPPFGACNALTVMAAFLFCPSTHGLECKAGAMHIGQMSIGTLAQSRAMHVTERIRLIPRRAEYMADHRQ